MSDLAYSLRTLLRHPRYTVMAVLTLAVGIGVTAAMFGLLDVLFFRPLPVKDADRLRRGVRGSNNRFGPSLRRIQDLVRATPAFWICLPSASAA
jgi:hypothetical protein